MALFTPLKLGRIQLSHRMIMAPLTRFRADENHVPLDIAVEYYSQRASVPGTLLITEGTVLSPTAVGWLNEPMIHSPEQIAAWKRVTDAVHSKGSYIFSQLFTVGREVSPQVLQMTGQPLRGASAIPMESGGLVPYEMSDKEIWGVVNDFVQAAKNAIEAGFDGVEIHGANGYLTDQFTQDTANQRTDQWGGSIENRSRFLLEITKGIVAAVGSDRVGIRLSPFSTFQGMGMADPLPQFSYLIRCLKHFRLAYLHMVESRVSGAVDTESTEKIDFAIDIWDGTSPVLIAGGFMPESAKRAVEEYAGRDVGIVFGRYFISNPDLPFRVREGVGLNAYDRATFYTPKEAKGYVDYPFSQEFEKELARSRR
ncbi:MAG: hypothetical protein Q9210_002651 [Variospora velana]